MKYITLILVLLFINCKKNNNDFDIIQGEYIDLTDTKWSIFESNVIQIINKDGVKYPIIWFKSEGFGVQSSCNYMAGEIKMTPSSFTYKSLGTTYLHCNDQQNKIEGYFLALRNTEIRYKYSNGILYLFKGDKLIGSFKRID